MDFLTDWLTGWLKDLLIDGIMGNLGGLFDNVNASVGDVAAQVGTTPAAWNAGVFSLIQQLSETVILPIAGMVLTFVATYELIQMLLEKNNMHEVDVANIYKWMFKTAIAILILSNTFNIVMAVFDVSQSVISSASGLIQGSTDISADMLADLETTLEGMGVGELLGLFMQSILIQVCMFALNIIIFVIVYGRMLEIYLMTSLAPIPVATLSNRELGSMGQNYIKSLFAVGFQGLLILVCVAIYAVLVQGIALADGAGILLDVERAEPCADAPQYVECVPVADGIGIGAVERDKSVARIEADTHLLQSFGIEKCKHRFSVVGETACTVFHTKYGLCPVSGIAGLDETLQFGQRLPALCPTFGEIAVGRENRSRVGVNDEVLRPEMFDGQLDQSAEFRNGRCARLFVPGCDVVGLIRQVQPPEIGFHRADGLAAGGEKLLQFGVVHAGCENDVVAGHDVDAHADGHGPTAVGRIDLIDRDEFSGFELQIGN